MSWYDAMKPHYKDVTVNTFDRCSCGKVNLPSAKAARKAIKANAAKGHTGYHAYRCPESGLFHLTKRESWDTRR